MTATVEAPVMEHTTEEPEVPLAERMAALPMIRPNDLTWPHGDDSVRRVSFYAPEFRVHEPITVLATRRTGSNNTWVLLPDRSMTALWNMGWGHDSDVSRVIRDRYPHTRGVFVFLDSSTDTARLFDVGDPLPVTVGQAEEGRQYLAITSADAQRSGTEMPEPFPVIATEDKTSWKHAETGAIHRGAHTSIVDFGEVEEPPTDPTERAEWERDKAQRELAAFKTLVAKRLVDETNSRNWCSEAEGWLRSLGLEPPPERYRVLVSLYVEDATSTENATEKIRQEFGARVYEMGRAVKAPRT